MALGKTMRKKTGGISPGLNGAGRDSVQVLGQCDSEFVNSTQVLGLRYLDKEVIQLSSDAGRLSSLFLEGGQAGRFAEVFPGVGCAVT